MNMKFVATILTTRKRTVNQDMPNCWEILKCGREGGGENVQELGECIASRESMGHSCWVVAGTLCGGEVQCSIARKIHFCTCCKVYQTYSRINGVKGKEVAADFLREDEKYMRLMINWFNHGSSNVKQAQAI